jgi:ribosomal peptide maturation radical SAM protein 1
LLDAFLDELVARHRLDQATIVGCTCLFFQTNAAFALARRIKHRNPAVTTVVGGAACETTMGLEFARRVPQVDFVFSGPALVSFPEFVARHLAGDHLGCTRIDGVFCRANLDQVADPPCPGRPPDPPPGRLRPTGTERDINAVVPLDYRVFLDAYERRFPAGDPAPMLLFETSRGCSWGEKSACTFCGLNGATLNHRAMSPEHAAAHLRDMLGNAPRCRFFLAVDTILPATFLGHVFPALTPPPGVAIMYEVRPVLGDHELETLCRAGVLVIQPGIESLSTATLRLMRKGTTAFGNLQFLIRCSRLPLRVEWNLLVGSPGEPEDTTARFLELIPRLTHLPPPGGAFPVSFDRFSRYFHNPAAHALELQPHESNGFAFPFPPAALERIAYHFTDRRSDPARLDHHLDQLNTAIARWHDRHHGRDGRPPARLCRITHHRHPALLDLRDGHPRTLALDPDSAAALAWLTTPRRLAGLADHLGPAAADRGLARLRDLGVLFEEDGRALSLVT